MKPLDRALDAAVDGGLASVINTLSEAELNEPGVTQAIRRAAYALGAVLGEMETDHRVMRATSGLPSWAAPPSRLTEARDAYAARRRARVSACAWMWAYAPPRRRT